MLTYAFKARTWELSMPEWLKEVRIEIAAKPPNGATREQIAPMLESLLVDRFKLAFHREKREMPVYELVVVKMGPNLKEIAGPVSPSPQTAPDRPPAVDGDGFPIIPGGSGWRVVNGAWPHTVSVADHV